MAFAKLPSAACNPNCSMMPGCNRCEIGYIPANGDVIDCILTSDAACVSPASATSTGITMTVNPNVTPSVTITATPGNVVNTGTSVTFTANVTNGGTSPQYQWRKNGMAIPAATGNSFTTASLVSGDVITVKVHSNIACANLDTVLNNAIMMDVGTSGVDDGIEPNNLQLIPNPNGGTFTVAGTLQYSGQTVWEVTDVLVQVVFREQVSVTRSDIQKEIRLQDDPAPGMYLLKITGSGYITTLRFVIVVK